MRKRGSWRFKAALLLGLSPLVAARASEPDAAGPVPDAKPSTSQNWFIRWFSPAPKTQDKKAAPATGSGQPAAVGKSAAGGHDPAAERAREWDKLLRRTEACLQLQEIADKTNDEALRNQAEQLSDRASEIYNRRVASIPVPVTPRAPGERPDDLDNK
ncbi:MAG TPA: hypothetical protein VG013_04265 [Gemmataceae bacterium]|jgi:hypothetical protein|nr:hypothetical protein [Gemmataceae bacterium]